MFWYVLFGFLAAFGLLCATWVLFGLILPRKVNCDVAVVCCKGSEIAVIRRFCRLRELGLTKSSLTVLGSNLTQCQQEIIRKRYPYIRFCDRETGQGREWTHFGTGTGNPAGHNCRCCIPEL